MNVKKSCQRLKATSTLAINETSKQLEQQGKKIFKFGFGQSPFKVPEDVVEELKSNAYQNKYLPMQGPAWVDICFDRHYFLILQQHLQVL